jgi:hypothetical protein
MSSTEDRKDFIEKGVEIADPIDNKLAAMVLWLAIAEL